MSEIKPIQTRYKGYHFRSRLEARWAVFFDSLGIEWMYEPEGFLGLYGEYYLPDFKIKCYNYQGNYVDFWIEVKPSGKLTQADSNKIYGVIDWGSVIPDFNIDYYEGDNAFMVLGNIPDPFGKMPGFRFLRNCKGITHEYAIFCPHIIKGNQLITHILPIDGTTEFCGDFEIIDSQESYQEYSIPYPRLVKAFLDARSARFEHGQNGAT